VKQLRFAGDVVLCLMCGVAAMQAFFYFFPPGTPPKAIEWEFTTTFLAVALFALVGWPIYLYGREVWTWLGKYLYQHGPAPASTTFTFAPRTIKVGDKVSRNGGPQATVVAINGDTITVDRTF
jgi:hypothetical protein